MTSLLNRTSALAAMLLGPAAALAGIANASVLSADRSHREIAQYSDYIAQHSDDPADVIVITQNESSFRVVVTLKGLEAGPEWAERIAAARARVMRALAGHRVEINREYDLVPALALTVDSDALRILRAHPDVAGVAEDGVSSPASGASTQPAR